jgi:hypothetical protein
MLPHSHFPQDSSILKHKPSDFRFRVHTNYSPDTVSELRWYFRLYNNIPQYIGSESWLRHSPHNSPRSIECKCFHCTSIPTCIGTDKLQESSRYGSSSELYSKLMFRYSKQCSLLPSRGSMRLLPDSIRRKRHSSYRLNKCLIPRGRSHHSSTDKYWSQERWKRHMRSLLVCWYSSYMWFVLIGLGIVQ